MARIAHHNDKQVYTEIKNAVKAIQNDLFNKFLSCVANNDAQLVQKMIENEDYCMDILTQNLAIQKSIGSLNKLILENHVRTHIKENLSSNSEDEQEKAIAELLSLYELTNIRGK